MKAQKSIYISHAWGGTSDEILAQLVQRLEAEKIGFILDKRDLAYRQSIHDFMVRLGKADMVIIILSNKYLKSEYCMFELIQIYHNESLTDRIFPIVLDEVKISSSVDRLDFVKFWENQLIELQNKVKELNSLSYIEGITDDLNLYAEIRNNIARLTGILRDINTLNITLHQESDYHDLIRAIRNRINEEPAQPEVLPPVENHPAAKPEEEETPKVTSTQPLQVLTGQLKNLVIVALAFFGLFMLWGIFSKSKSLANDNDGPNRSDTELRVDSQQVHYTLQPTAPFNKDTTKEKVYPEPVKKEPGTVSTSIKKSKELPDQGIQQKQIIKEPPATVLPEPKVQNKPVDLTISQPPQNETVKEEPVKKPAMTHTVNIPKGADIVARPTSLVSSDDPDPVPRQVTFVLDKALYDGSQVAVPAGSLIMGSVVKVKKSEYRRSGTMDLNFEYLLTPGGQKIPLQSNEMHLEAKGDVPYQIQINTKLQIKISSTVAIKY